MSTGSFRHAAALIALLGIVPSLSFPALAAGGPETFGPGKVDCQRLNAGQFDCLLTSLMISNDGRGVAAFSLDVLPPTERAIFEKWCSKAADDCTIELQGARQAPGGSRLSAVTSVHWTRLRPPNNQAAARASP